MDDVDFFSHLLQLWTHTTGAENKYWQPEQDAEAPEFFNIYAVGEDQTRKLVASNLSDEDSDWVTAVHGCFGDLVQRMFMALDESENLDNERDQLVCRVAVLEQEADEANRYFSELDQENTKLEAEVARLRRTSGTFDVVDGPPR